MQALLFLIYLFWLTSTVESLESDRVTIVEMINYYKTDLDIIQSNLIGKGYVYTGSFDSENEPKATFIRFSKSRQPLYKSLTVAVVGGEVYSFSHSTTLKNDYVLIVKELNALGFKLRKSEVHDEILYSRYESLKFSKFKATTSVGVDPNDNTPMYSVKVYDEQIMRNNL